MMSHPASDTENVADARALARTIVDQLVDGVLIMDGEGVVRFANEAAARLFGRPRDQLLGEALGYPIVVGESTEVEVIRPGGEVLLVEMRAAEVPWQDGVARLISLRDMTERRRVERRVAELERQRVRAEAANRAKADFLAVMSHELRTPLNAILGYSELLGMGVHGELSEQQRQHVERVQASAKHLLALVNDVLDLSKIEAGRLTVLDGCAPLDATATAAVEIVRPVAEARDITLHLHCAAQRGDYRGDESRVRQILVNLLQNAVKFTPPGGSVTLECGFEDGAPVEARLPRAGHYAFFRVTDTGIGIPPTRLAAIFDPFVQVDSGHTRRNDGSGLGLSISRRLARRMEGDITVTSAEGKGSTFTLWLLRADDAASNDGEANSGNGASAVLPRPDAGDAILRNGTAGDMPPSDGDGTSAEAGAAIPSGSLMRSAAAAQSPAVADVGEALLQAAASIVSGLVTRIRQEPSAGIPADLRYADLANHFVSFVAVLAETLMTRAEPGATNSKLIEEDLEILQMLAERHGEQRARLGFAVTGLECEWGILLHEIDAALGERTADLQPRALDEARGIIQRAVARAEARSRETFRALG